MDLIKRLGTFISTYIFRIRDRYKLWKWIFDFILGLVVIFLILYLLVK
jgi:hypothetical protein